MANLSIKLLNFSKRLFYFNDANKLKENKEIYNIVISINHKILKNLKISNTILNKNKENKTEINTNLTNIFTKNLKIFEENFFEILFSGVFQGKTPWIG